MLFMRWPGCPGSGGVQRMMEGEGDGGTVAAGLIDADAAPELFGGMLYLPETLGNGAVEVSARVSYPDHRPFPFDDGLDMDTFFLGGMDDPVEQVPKHVSKHMLVDTQLQLPVNFIDDDAFSLHGQGKKAGCQRIDEMMKADPGVHTVQGIHKKDFIP
jgi:hypothetical protein